MSPIKRVEIPDEQLSGRNMDERVHLPIKSYSVNEWGPESDGKGPPTQVHLCFDVEGTPISLVLAFKSSDAVDRMIAALMRHRNGVWGDR